MSLLEESRGRVRDLAERVGSHVPPLLRDVVRESLEDRVNGLAAEIAFFGILGIFPGLLMVTALLSSLDAFVGQEVADRAQRIVIDGLNQVLTEEASGAVRTVRSLFENDRTGLLTTAMVGAAWAISRSFSAVINALDVAYDLEETRPWVLQRAVGAALAIGTVLTFVVVVAMVVVGPFLGGGRAVADSLGLGDAFAFAWTWLRWPVLFGVLVVWTTTMFHVGPNVRTRWRTQAVGGITAAVLWLLLSLGFRWYLEFAGGANAVVGVLGGALALLLWMYLLALAMLVAAELNAVLHARHGEPQGPPRRDGSTNT